VTPQELLRTSEAELPVRENVHGKEVDRLRDREGALTKSNEKDSLTRLAGLLSVILGSTLFLVLGFSLERSSRSGSCDFESVYYHARILVQHQDPYVESPAIFRQLQTGGFLDPKLVNPTSVPGHSSVYPPTALFLASPLALLTWQPAHMIWLVCIAAGLVVSAAMIWWVGAQHAPFLSGILIGFTLANSSTLLFEANAAGIAVGCCIVAVIFIIKCKFPFVAALCLAVSLCVKPHDAFLVWAYLLLAGGVYRRRALQALVLTLVIAVPAIGWVSSVSPHWRQEMASNISSISSPGGVNDPGPKSATSHVTDAAVNIQTVFAVIEDQPQFYNTASYVLCAILFLILIRATMRQQTTEQSIWLPIAVVATLTMLPVYHRHHDAKLLLLAVPACAFLWAQGRTVGRLSALVTLAAMMLVGDFPRVILAHLEKDQIYSAESMTNKVRMILFVRPAPIALLVMTLFFLWVCVHPDLHCPELSTSNGSEETVVQVGD
jgi:hypothetical protein